MKMSISKEWLQNKLEQDGPDEPGGIMAMSPMLATYSEAQFYASPEISWDDVSYVVCFILVIANLERDYTDEGHKRWVSTLERAIKFAKRVNKKYDLKKIAVDL